MSMPDELSIGFESSDHDNNEGIKINHLENQGTHVLFIDILDEGRALTYNFKDE